METVYYIVTKILSCKKKKKLIYISYLRNLNKNVYYFGVGLSPQKHSGRSTERPFKSFFIFLTFNNYYARPGSGAGQEGQLPRAHL